MHGKNEFSTSQNVFVFDRIKMSILLLFFASISAIQCAVAYPPQINYTISRIADAAVVDCDTKFGYSSSDGQFRQLITDVEVFVTHSQLFEDHSTIPGPFVFRMEQN